MRLFSQSVADAVDKMMRANGTRRTLITLPSYEAPLMLAIAERMKKIAAKYNADLVLKIASRTMEDWPSENFEFARKNDWEDERGNLTYYRNTAGADVYQLVVLCGADKVTDTAGLEDFIFCDENYIWTHNSDTLFSSWLQFHFSDEGLQFPKKDKINTPKIFDLLNTLRILPSGGLIHISDWIDSLDVNNVITMNELLQVMLTHLSSFNLPNCIGYASNKCKSKTFMQYAKAAQPFFDYSSLIGFGNRKNSRNQVEKAIERLSEDNQLISAFVTGDKEKIFPTYDSVQDFFEGVLRYINEESEEDRNKIYCCDFVSLHDYVLRSRSSGGVKKKKTKVLHGPLFDCLLIALWSTFEQCSKDKELVLPEPLYVRVRGGEYRYINEVTQKDLDLQIDSKDLADDRDRYAKKQLQQVIDGVDELLESHLYDKNFLCISSSLLEDARPIATKKEISTLNFTIEILTNFEKEAIILCKQEFEWKIPENQCEVLDAELIKRANNACKNGNFLPVFHVQYYNELLNVAEGDDTNEILWHSLRDTQEDEFANNLLGENQNCNNQYTDFISLIDAYKEFIRYASEHSLIGALTKDENNIHPWKALKSAYEAALEKGRDLAKKGKKEFGAMLMRAFLVTNRSLTEQEGWRTNAYEDSAVITVLHPALLEQIQSRIIFLCAGFRQIFKQELEKTKQKFSASVLQHYLSISRTHVPLCTLPRTRDMILTSEVRGERHIHKIGHIERPGADTLSTRLHGDGGFFQEDLHDSDLYTKSEESRLFTHLLHQYYKLCPHAGDGISLAVFRNSSIQPVIAGVHDFLQSITTALKGRDTPYEVRLLLISDSSDAADLRIWITHWQERWAIAREDDSESSNSCYRHCHIKVAHQLVSDFSNIETLVKSGELQVDIAFLYDMFGMSKPSCAFDKIPAFDVTETELKFPIIEKKYCFAGGNKLERARVLSVRQFPVATRHMELLAALKQNALLSETGSLLLVSTGNFDCLRDTIAKLHKVAEWVVCIDPAIDEALIKDSVLGDATRDLVAFGAGVGSQGESNYTVSSELRSRHDLCRHIGARLRCLYADTDIDTDDCLKMANKLLHAEKLAGMALIRAASLQDEHIREFLAYSLSRHLLRDEKALCDTMISLDAYRHWLPAKSVTHPDLLWFTVEHKEDQLHLHVKVIECKLAGTKEEHVRNGREQLYEGLKFLTPKFRPYCKEEPDDARPDRRYWWHQLHRVISSSVHTEHEEDSQTIRLLLEQLAEGQFSITWEALLLTYWLDSNQEAIELSDAWNIDGVPAYHFSIGWPVQKKLALEEVEPGFWAKILEEACPEDLIQHKFVINSYDFTVNDQDTDASEDDSENDAEDDENDGTELPWDRNYLSANELAGGGNHSVNTNPDSSSDQEDESMDSDTDNKKIETVEPVDNSKKITITGNIGCEEQEPEHILLGTDRRGQPVYWKFRNALNKHMIIFGSSGNGKTYAIQCILSELTKQNVNNLVVDFSQSFAPGEIKPQVSRYFPREEQHILAHKPLPINPLSRQKIFIDAEENGNGIDEKPVFVAGRITDIFKNIYNLGTQQVNFLQDAIIECIREKTSASFNDIERVLSNFKQENTYGRRTIETLKSHIHNFLQCNPFTEPQDDMGWTNLYETKPACNHVFQLMSIPQNHASAIIEFVLWDLFFYAQRVHTMKKNTSVPVKVICLDEFQNLNLAGGSPVYRILTEGRKFGISLIAATQSLTPVKPFMSTLQQAACKLYFRPADIELPEFGNQLHAIDSSLSSHEWRESLAKLGRGECYVVGQQQSYGSPVRFVKITSMENRDF